MGAGGLANPSKMPRCRPDRLIADQLAALTRFYSATHAPLPAADGADARYPIIVPDALPANPPPGGTRNPLQGSRTPFH